MLKKPVFKCKIKTPSEQTLIFIGFINTSPEAGVQMFIKIGVLKNFANTDVNVLIDFLLKILG